MQIKQVLSQLGNDFTAILECEHCGGTQKLMTGYNDGFYYTKVIPSITCKACGKNRAGDMPEPNPNGTKSV